jgi:arylsulfatase A-like enzyme
MNNARNGLVRSARAITTALGVAVVLGGLLASVAQARPAGQGKDHRPNILVVMTDDMAKADVAFMPNVRKLIGKQGTTFADAVDSFPLCCPARATFITGQYAHNHGVGGNFWPYGWYGMAHRKNILPAWLDRSGYETALIGKWLNGYGARDAHGEVPFGFDYWRGLLDVSAYDYYNFVMNKNGKLKSFGDADFARKLVEFASIEALPHEQTVQAILAQLQKVMGPPPYSYWGTADPKNYSPDVTARVTDQFLRAQKKSDKPFFTWWAPAAPHREDVAVTLMGRPGADPRPPVRYEASSKSCKLPKPPSFNESDLSDKGSPVTGKAPVLSQAQIDQLQLDYEGRCGSLKAVDDGVGRMIKTLKRTGQLRNTVVMFLSDNGWLQGEHRIPGDKFLPYEESVRVPLIIRGPGIPKGRTIHGQVGNIDFAPTLVDAANARAGRKMDGVSLLPTARNPKKLPKRAIELEALRPLFEGNIPNNAWDRPYKGVRTDRYTFFVWTETGEQELYDRQKDPYQLTNVAADPSYAAIKASLQAKLTKLDSCRGRSCLVRP